MIIVLQTGGFTVANLIWDMMQDRKSALSLPAVEAYYQGLKVTPKSKKIISIVLRINYNLHCVNEWCISVCYERGVARHSNPFDLLA